MAHNDNEVLWLRQRIDELELVVQVAHANSQNEWMKEVLRSAWEQDGDQCSKCLLRGGKHLLWCLLDV